MLPVGLVLRDLLMRPLWAIEWEEKHTGVGRKHDASPCVGDRSMVVTRALGGGSHFCGRMS